MKELAVQTPFFATTLYGLALIYCGGLGVLTLRTLSKSAERRGRYLVCGFSLTVILCILVATSIHDHMR